VSAATRSGRLVGIQRRMMELGRIRMGDKRGAKGSQRKLSCFRLTSASRALLEAAAAEYGGQVRVWDNAPDEGYYELYTETSELEILLPPTFADADGSPTVPYSQFYERWTRGGCERRCDGETELLSGKACICGDERGTDPERFCRITTRLSVMLPRVPGLGVWKLETHGYNAAAMLPATLEVLLLAAAEHKFIPGILRLEPKSSRKGGKTFRYVVPVIDLPSLKIGEVLAGGGIVALNAPGAPLPRPELPSGEDPSDPEEFADLADPPLGEAPELGEVVEPGEDMVSEETSEQPDLLGGETSSPEIDTLWRELSDTLIALGAEQNMEQVNAKAAIGDRAWLRRNLATAKAALEQKRRAEGPAGDHGTPHEESDEPDGPDSPSAGGQESFFEARAKKAQARKVRS